MHLALTEDQSILAEQLQEFARGTLTRPHTPLSQEAAQARFEQLAAQGVIGLCIPEEDGGPGVDPVTLCRCLSAVAAVDASLATMAAVLNGVVAEALLASDHPVRATWLEALLSGAPMAVCASHPGEVQAIRHTTDADEQRFSGHQSNVLMASFAKHFLVAATNEAGLVHLYPFGFMDPATEGVQLKPTKRPLGLRDAGIADVVMEWSVPGGGRPLFADADTAQLCQRVWNRGQVALAAVSLGVAQAALDHACAYAQERKQFGKPIAAFQAIQWKVADMAMGIEGAKLLVDRAAYAWQKDDDAALATWSCAARIAAQDAATFASEEAIQIHGGYGFTTEFPVEHLYRNAHALRCLWPAQDQANVAHSQLHHF